MCANIATPPFAGKNQAASFTVELSAPLQGRLQKFADEQSKSPESVISEAVQGYIDYQEKVHTFAAEAREIWNDFDADGRKGAIPLSAVTPWLNSWGKQETSSSSERTT